MNEIWTIELDLLEKFKSICKKYNLTYYASCGTLLGAIRHKGFIPWDDDIDIFLMWPDYKKLMQVAPAECNYPYFFQSIYTEEDSMANASRLRRSDTTGFTKWEYENVRPEYDKGIFIDIFPLFYVPDSAEEKAIQKERVMYYWEAIHGYDAIKQRRRGGKVNRVYENCIPTFAKCCGTTDIDKIDIVSLKEKYLDACAMISERTKEVGITSSRCHLPTLMWNTEWFDEIVELPFENTTIHCPKEYERILEKEYGDWRIPVENGSCHEIVGADINTPWKQYDYSKLV